MAIQLQVEGLTKSFGDLVLFNKICFTIEEGQRIGLIAKNGSGKTTLLNILAGIEGSDEGNIVARKGVKVAYLPQDPQYPAGLTVREACFHSDNPTVKLIAEYELCMQTEGHPGLDELLSKMEQEKAWDYERVANQILFQLKITNLEQKVEHLSGGQLKRVALANTLVALADEFTADQYLLILDEPTNHLDLDMTEWLEGYLRKNNVSLLMVTHDRYFLDRVCSQIIEIDNKQIYIYKGNYSYYLEKREERIDSQNTEFERATNLYKTELEWMRRMPQARATKAKSRQDAFYELEKVAKQTTNNSQVGLNVKASYIGSKIFEATNVSKSFGDLKIVENFTYTFSRYEKMGIVGNNGTGKSTFIKLLMGELTPDSGAIEVGETVKFGYYSQNGLQFDDKMKVIDVVQNIAEVIDLGNGKQLSASQFLQHFLFTPETQYNYVAKLSGGERRRLYLCTVLIQNPNFLILDEPTNDLDIITLNVLEEYLMNFKGCVIVVSHDRYFMDKVVDHLMVFSGNAVLKDFPGNYTDYRQWKEEKENQERKEESAKQKAEKDRIKTPTPLIAQSTNGKRKLTYKEKRELEGFESELMTLETEKKEIEAVLNSGSLDATNLTQQSKRIAEIIDLIETKTLRWLELSEME